MKERISYVELINMFLWNQICRLLVLYPDFNLSHTRVDDVQPLFNVCQIVMVHMLNQGHGHSSIGLVVPPGSADLECRSFNTFNNYLYQ